MWMSKNVPYELPDGDFVKYVEQSHQQSILQAQAEKEKALARLNASATTDSPQDSLRKIREQHERTMQDLRNAANNNSNKEQVNLGPRTTIQSRNPSTPNQTGSFSPSASAPQTQISSRPYTRSSNLGTNRTTSRIPRPQNHNNDQPPSMEFSNVPPNNSVDRKLKKLIDMRAAFLMFTLFFTMVFFLGTESDMEDADSRVFAILMAAFGCVTFVLHIAVKARRRALNQPL